MPQAEAKQRISEPEMLRIAEAAVSLGYTIIRRLDSGAAGEVFVAQDSGGHPVALKVFYGPYEERWLRRFRQEVEILSRLNHARVVRVLPPGLVSFGERMAYAMDFVDGISLRRWLAANRPLTEVEVLRLLSLVGEAVAYVHANHVIHRDLHSGNILLDGQSLDNPRLVDFGTARDYSIQDLFDTSGYRTFRPIGSMSHCAPEKWVSPHSAGPESDIFSLGVMAYNAVTGQYPFWAESYVQLYQLILGGHHKSAQELRSELSRDFSNLLEDMLNPSQVFRTPSVEDVVIGCKALLARSAAAEKNDAASPQL